MWNKIADFSAIFLRHYKPLTCFVKPLTCFVGLSYILCIGVGCPIEKGVFVYVNDCEGDTVIFKNESVICIHAVFITSKFVLVIERVLFKDSVKF